MKLGVFAPALVTERTPEAFRPEALFPAAQTLGVQHLELLSGGWDEPGFVERVGSLQQRYGIGVHLGFGEDYVGEGSARAAERLAQMAEQVCRPLGVRVLGIVSPFHGGRWLKEPPLADQLARLTAGLRRLAPIAERHGVLLAIENHADYRGHELASVLAAVGSPAIGARFDTANPYAAIEEPVAAAEALARYTVSTHVKAVVVEAEPGNRGLPGGLLALRSCALGDGHVDLPRIVALLAEQGPLGGELVLTLETSNEFIAASVQSARRTFSGYLE